jgi:hypothetical protein
MRWHWWLLLVVVFFCLGCAISEEQIDKLSKMTEDTITYMVETGIKVSGAPAPLIEILGGGGLGGLLGALGGRFVRKLLKSIQTKPAPLVE